MECRAVRPPSAPVDNKVRNPCRRRAYQGKHDVCAQAQGAVPVTTNEPDALRGRLDALSGHIDRRVREWQERGAFSHSHDARMDDIRKRSAAIQKKLDAAIEGRHRWDMLKYEVERDLHSLNEDFVEFERHLDAAGRK
jgi:hypothetical protein